MLDAALSRRGVTVAVAAAVFAGSLVLAPFLGAEFIPTLDEGAIALHIQRLPSISLETSNQISLLAERVILDHFGDEVETVISRTAVPRSLSTPWASRWATRS